MKFKLTTSGHIYTEERAAAELDARAEANERDAKSGK